MTIWVRLKWLRTVRDISALDIVASGAEATTCGLFTQGNLPDHVTMQPLLSRRVIISQRKSPGTLMTQLYGIVKLEKKENKVKQFANSSAN